MITSKRDLKKHIDSISADVVQSVIPAAVCSGALPEEKAAEILSELAKFNAQARSHMSFAFDKSAKAFDSITAYKAARRQYFKTAFSHALAEYQKGVNEIIKSVKAN